jgi:glutathione S-transferase
MNTVYGAILSPFVRKVLMVLEHKQQSYHCERVLPFANSPSYAAKHPLRKIPAFEDEYITLADSSVICDYLENKYPQPALYPKTPVERAKALWLEEYADTALQQLLGPGVFFAKLVAPAMYGTPVDQQKIDHSLQQLPPCLDYLERDVAGSGYLVGGELSIADLSVASVFLNGYYAGFEVDAARWPKLAAYLQRLFAHPLFLKRIEQERPLLEGLTAKR